MSFDDSLRYGTEGERIVFEWLQKDGFFVIPTAKLPTTRRFSGPRMETDRLSRILMDAQIARQGVTRWIEVKTKSQDVWYQKAGEYRQGIDEQNFSDYQHIELVTGMEAWLAILVASPGNSRNPILRMAPLKRLAEHAKPMTGDPTAYKGKRMVYWCVDIFDNYELIGETLVRQEPKVQHPWSRIGERPQMATQGYFRF